MTPTTSLFDVRGGSLLAHRCEICNEELEHDALSPVCAVCHTQEEEDNA